MALSLENIDSQRGKSWKAFQMIINSQGYSIQNCNGGGENFGTSSRQNWDFSPPQTKTSIFLTPL